MRASVARRTSAGLGSPAALRARSQERSVDDLGEGRFDENQNDVLVVGSENVDTETTVDSSDGAHKSNHSARGNKSHRRAMSDPFDTPELGGTTDAYVKDPTYDTEDDENEDGFGSEVVLGLPTLPR